MYDCNYLCFRNINFGSKWFYAFIDKIEYINNATSEIYYSIDLIQTWMFDYSLEQCFVEREHTITDEIGDNIVDEKLDTGEYVSEDMQYLDPGHYQGDNFHGYQIAVWCTFTEDGTPVGGTIWPSVYQKYFSGLYAVRFNMTQAGIEDCINWIIGLPALKQEKIVSVGILPQIAIRDGYTNYNIQKFTNLLRADGTQVKNNKCKTYPYNFLYVTNSTGNSAVYRYEFFSTANCVFSAFCGVCPTPTLIMFPDDYKGVSTNLDEKIELSGYPQIAFNTDSYKAWLAQNASSIGLNSLATLTAGAAILDKTMPILSTATEIGPYIGGAAGAVAGGTVGTAVAIAALLPEIKNILSGIVHAFMPPQSRGTQGGTTLLALDKLKFAFMHKHITPEYVTIIDDYFSMYGYACHKVKIPNTHSRPEWNYVKTVGCKIYGGVPSDDAVEIEKIYDSGIRFWKNPDHIGVYTYDNSPVTPPVLNGGE